MDLEFSVLGSGLGGDELLHLHDEFVQDVHVHDAEEEEEGGGDGGADDAAYAGEVVEFGGHGGSGTGNDEGGDDHDGGVAEAEVHADCDGALAGGDEAARHEVDGGDVVCVQGMAESEGPRKNCCGYKRGMEMLVGLAWPSGRELEAYQDNAYGYPNKDIDCDQGCNDGYGREGKFIQIRDT